MTPGYRDGHNVLPSFLAVTLIGFVLSGLLSFPASCACGDSVPHPHALFELPGHYHDSHDHDHPSDDQERAHSSEAAETAEAVTNRSYLQSRSTAPANQIFLSMAGFLALLSLTWTRWSIRPQQATLPPEWIGNTDDPPPR